MSASDEMWDFVHKRWEEADRRRAAAHRRRMRWWKHAREYVSMKRLFVNGLVGVSVNWSKQVAENDEFRSVYDGLTSPELPDHPPWSGPSNWWPRYRWCRQG